jgi:hypothetical protein
LLAVWREGETPGGAYWEWTCFGAIVGFLAGLCLLFRKRFVGGVLVALGLLGVLLPWRAEDAPPPGNTFILIRSAITVGLLGLGVFLHA